MTVSLPSAAVDQHEPAAADLAAARVDHGQRIADRDGRIDRVATGGENLQPDVARLVLGGGDHAVRAPGFGGGRGKARGDRPSHRQRGTGD